MQTSEPSLSYVLGKATRAVGRFARDVAYMEFVPKGIVSYRPSYLTNVTAVLPLRLIAKMGVLGALYAAGRDAVDQGLAADPKIYIPAVYVTADIISNGILAASNLFRRTRGRYSDWEHDNLNDQPATVAIEVPYRMGRGVVKAVKHFANREKAVKSD